MVSTTHTTDVVIGQEYVAVDVGDDQALYQGQSLVPIGYDDTGNLEVEHYDEPAHPDGHVLAWSEDGFTELIDDGTLAEAGA